MRGRGGEKRDEAMIRKGERAILGCEERHTENKEEGGKKGGRERWRQY